MNLHEIVRGVISAVNPDSKITILKCVGFEHQRGGINTPIYETIQTTAQVQPVSSDDLKFENNYYSSSSYRNFYMNGIYNGLNRRDGTGGDKIIWDGKTWFIDSNPEPWNTAGWTKVRGVQELSGDEEIEE